MFCRNQKNRVAHIAGAILLSLLVSGCTRLFRFGGDNTENGSAIWTVNESPKSLLLESPKPISAEARAIKELLGTVGSGGVVEPDRDSGAIPLSAFLEVRAHEGSVNALAISQDGLNAFSGGEDGRVVVTTLIKWIYGDESPNTSRKQFARTETLLKGDRPILALSLSPNQRYLAVTQFSALSIYDLGRRQIVSRLTRVKGRMTAVTWDPKGELVAFGMAGGATYVWNLRRGPALGRDTLDDIELYQGEDSPVTGLIFHPQGRILIAAQRDGRVDLWRLIRTEKEMGLFDEYALIDQAKQGSERMRAASLDSRIAEIWLSPNGDQLFIGATDGNIYQWKIRGLVKGEPIARGREAITGLAGFRIQSTPVQEAKGRASSAVPMVELIAASSRDQRLKFWCEHAPIRDTSKTSGTVLSQSFVAESELFVSPPSVLVAGSSSSILWAVEKTGNLIIFDSRTLLTSPVWRSRMKPCVTAHVDEARQR